MSEAARHHQSSRPPSETVLATQGADAGDITIGPAAQPLSAEDQAARVAEIRTKVNEQLGRDRGWIEAFALDTGFSFLLGSGFYIDFKNKQVSVDVGWFIEQGYTLEQIHIALGHEFTHWRDYKTDPAGMLKVFEDIQQKAINEVAPAMERRIREYYADDPKGLAQMLAAFHRKPKPDLNRPEAADRTVLSQGQTAAYQMLHTFFNCRDDMVVNTRMPRRAARFNTPQSRQSMRDLYATKLFPNSDLTQLPLHKQYSYALLRDLMVPDQLVIVSPEVRAMLDEPIQYLGHSYTTTALVQEFLLHPDEARTTPSKRAQVMRYTLEPRLMKLVQMDIEAWEPKLSPPQPGQGDAGEGEFDPFDNASDPFQQSSPDQFSDKEMKDLAKTFIDDKAAADKQAADRAKEAGKTEADRAKELQQAQDKAFCKRHDIKPADLAAFRVVEEKTRAQLNDLLELWKRITTTTVSNRVRESVRWQIEGELDLQAVVDAFPAVQAATGDPVPVYERDRWLERPTNQPEQINIRLIVDKSGSVGVDPGKLETIKQALVLTLQSLAEFQQELDETRSQTETQLRINTECRAYGHDDEELKALSGADTDIGDERAAIVRAFTNYNANGGNTLDHLSLQVVADALSADDVARIRDGRLMEIVLLVTDGGSGDAPAARQIVDQLLSQGVIARAIQIGVVSPSETQLFNAVWNDDRSEPLGLAIGEDLPRLIVVLTELLKHYLSELQL